MKHVHNLIIAMIVFSVSIYWGAYAAVLIGFFILLWGKSKEVGSLLKKQKVIAVAAIALLLSTLFSRALGKSLVIDGVLVLHLMAFIVLVMGTKLEDLEKMYKLLSLLAVFICLYGIYQYLSGDLLINKSWTDQKTFGNLVRVYSTMRNPNIFAGYLAFNISCAFAYLLQKKSDLLTILSIVLSSICLILTYSRGGFIAFFAAMLVIMVLSKQWKVALYLIAMGLAYYAYNSMGSLNRADLGLVNTDSSSLYRLEIWKASFGLFRENMAFGSGLGSVMEYLSFSSAKLKGFIAHSHSIYIHLLAETGVAGLAAFLSVVVISLKKFLSFWIKYRESKHAYIALGFAASMTAMLVHGLVDCVMFIPTRSLIFLVYLSLFPILLYGMKRKEA